MKKLMKIVINEDGQVMVLAALLFTVLMGFGALAIDVGRITVEKSHLQNAVDAAALAAAQDLPDTSGGYANSIGTVTTYLEENGYTYSDIDPISAGSFSNSNKTITLKGAKDVGYTFAKLIKNEDSTTVKATAAAEVSLVLENLDYALFSGSELDMLSITSTSTTITGDVHSNYEIKGKANVIGEVTAVASIDSRITSLGGTHEDWPVQGMPFLSTHELDDLKESAISTGTYYSGNKSFSAAEINAAFALDAVIYVDGTVTTNGTGVSAHSGCIIATGNITFDGSKVALSTTSPICLYSSAGDVTLNGGGSSISGIVWAPFGSAEFNGNGGELTGRVYGNQVKLAGSIEIDSSMSQLPSLPVKTYKLVE